MIRALVYYSLIFYYVSFLVLMVRFISKHFFSDNDQGIKFIIKGIFTLMFWPFCALSEEGRSKIDQYL